MINIMSGTTAVTLTPNNVVSKVAKNTTIGVGGRINTANSISNADVNNADANSMQVQNTQSSQQQNSAANAVQSQVQAANTISVDYNTEAVKALQSRIRKEYIDRNFYIDDATKIPVIQIVNNETNRIIGQYPADMYLNLIMRIRENQKSTVNQTLADNQQTSIEQQLMVNQKS